MHKFITYDAKVSTATDNNWARAPMEGEGVNKNRKVFWTLGHIFAILKKFIASLVVPLIRDFSCIVFVYIGSLHTSYLLYY